MIRSLPMRRALTILVLAGLILPWATPALARIWTDTPLEDATLLPAPTGGTGGGPYGLNAVPAIPFAYFDPLQKRFFTVRTQPIPLKVKPADKLAMSQIID